MSPCRAISAALLNHVTHPFRLLFYSHMGMNSTFKILKIFGFVRKHRPKAAMMVGWQITDNVRPAPNDNRGLHLKGNRTIVLAVSPEGRKDSRKRKSIGFYETGDEVFSVIFSMMKKHVYSSLMNTRVVRSIDTEFSVQPSRRRRP